MAKLNTGTVTAYIDALPFEQGAALRTLRQLIERAAPKAKASMGLGLPSWDLKGPLFALSVGERDMTLFVSEPDLVFARKKSFGNVEVGKTSLKFKRLEDLDLASVEKLLVDTARRREGR
jgi:uncharacterized protein YdhG (YjbR/CyaY superfamily)